ncbi:hypothetical protein ABH897_003869 [Paenibacillus sp. RC73]
MSQTRLIAGDNIPEDAVLQYLIGAVTACAANLTHDTY